MTLINGSRPLIFFLFSTSTTSLTNGLCSRGVLKYQFSRYHSKVLSALGRKCRVLSRRDCRAIEDPVETISGTGCPIRSLNRTVSTPNVSARCRTSPDLLGPRAFPRFNSTFNTLNFVFDRVDNQGEVRVFSSQAEATRNPTCRRWRR